jgi:hypothetical protein
MFVAKGIHPPHPVPIFVFALRSGKVVIPAFTDSLIALFVTSYNQIRMRFVIQRTGYLRGNYISGYHRRGRRRRPGLWSPIP